MEQSDWERASILTAQLMEELVRTENRTHIHHSASNDKFLANYLTDAKQLTQKLQELATSNVLRENNL